MLFRYRTVPAALLAAIFASSSLTVRGATDKALFIELPTGALAIGVSPNGTVIGNYRDGAAFYWMPTTRDIYLGGRSAAGISRDGRVIVGTALDSRNFEQAGIWQRATEWRLLGSVVPNPLPCDALISSSYGTSADGSVIVGLAWNGCNFARAFRWEEKTGMVDLGSSVSGRSSRANGVSGDGQVVVGWQESSVGFRQGARWTNGKQELFTGPTGFVGEAAATNMGGSIVVGQGCIPPSPEAPDDQRPWMWTARDGLQCLDVPRQRLTGFRGLALATSEDGRVAGGGHSFGLESESIVWIDRMPSYLKDYLQSHGAPNAFAGWVNTGFVTGISPDGHILVGYGAGPKDFTGFIVVLPDKP